MANATTIKFRCRFCPSIFPNFKELMEHYEGTHKDRLKRYLVKNQRLKQQAIISATSPKEACKSLGWDMKDCWHIEEIK